ncbi:hypothetical protein AA0X95_16440 [Bacillus sp. 1P10SD]|uniref:hypothetical protein n=1 Tax=Bacillus sp. 1P10SD TaxID=3132265 RepID=UPI0039A6C05B
MEKPFYKEFGFSGSEKDKWERELLIKKLFEQGVEIEEIAKIAGLTDEEVEERFLWLD